MAKQDFPAIMSDIESGRLSKDVLTRASIQQLFRGYIEQAGGIALEIERQIVPKADDQELLHSAGNTVLRLFRIDAELLGTLLSKIGYTPEQRLDIISTCALTIEALGQSVQLVFESHKKHLPLLQEPMVRSLVHSTKGARLHAESPQRAFINYLQHEGFPSIVLERMARLSLYQEFNFDEDLKKNESLFSLYNTFLEKGALPKDQIVQAAKMIENGILERMRNHHLVIVHDPNGYDIAKSTALRKTDMASLYERAPSHYLDAHTVQDKVLYTSGVTANSDLESNQLGILAAARAIRHGMIRGTLKGIEDYEVRAYSNSEVYTNKEIQVALEHLISTHAIDSSQQQALFDLPLHQEMLKILANTTPEEYKEYAPHMRIGLYGDTHAPLTPKTANIQILLSIEQLLSASQTLKKITQANPSLDNMLTPVGGLSVQLTEAYRYARLLGHGHPNEHEIDEQLDKVGDVINDMYDVLNAAGSKIAPKVMDSRPSEPTIIRRRTRLAQTFEDIESSLIADTPTNASLLKDTKTYSSIDGATAATRISGILKGTYPAPTTPAMIRDALIQRIDAMETMAEKGTLRKDSSTQLKYGIKQLLKNPTMLPAVYEHIVLNAPELTKRILKWDGRGSGVEKEVKCSIKTRITQQKLGLVDAFPML